MTNLHTNSLTIVLNYNIRLEFKDLMLDFECKKDLGGKISY